jgi:hypothetical protein
MMPNVMTIKIDNVCLESSGFMFAFLDILGVFVVSDGTFGRTCISQNVERDF